MNIKKFVTDIMAKFGFNTSAKRKPASSLLEGLEPVDPSLKDMKIKPLPGDKPGIGLDHIKIK